MIDPFFLSRLENWSRAIRSSEKRNTSSMFQVMEVLRLLREPEEDEQGEEEKQERPSAIDTKDARILSEAYSSTRLSPSAREYLRVAFGECWPERRCARYFHQSVSLYRECLEAVVRRFQFVVENHFDNRGECN